MTFAELFKSLDWRPIRHCPGRFSLRGAKSALRLEELTGSDCEARAYTSSKARDIVLVAALDEGGVISYKREDGTLVHTLNTAEGFDRKLRQLGIDAGRS